MVLRHIDMNGGITRYGGKDRQWMFACSDARPHSLYQRILDEVMICDHCNEPCLNIQSYKQHHKENHKECIPSCSREFDWCYMRIGDGNFEMNAVKAFFELNWIPYLEKMCELMGFDTENAKHFAKFCKDHHVAWQLLLTFHMTALPKMVYPYIQHAKDLNQHQSSPL